MTITYNTILVQNITLSFNIANRMLQIEAETHQPGWGKERCSLLSNSWSSACTSDGEKNGVLF
jgi:hypothetical protein